jgi:uncharacterized protein (TIGR02594 family)
VAQPSPSTLDVQRRLKALGYYPETPDGDYGPVTTDAVARFQARANVHLPSGAPLAFPGTMGSSTVAALFAPDAIRAPAKPPWIIEAETMLGVHESRNYNRLVQWLRSAGKFIDPKRFAWCGDTVETAILRALPREPISAVLRENPFGARNWLTFGQDVGPRYGAVVVFWRGSLRGWLGHVGFVVGRSADGRYVYVLGGNQKDAINIMRLDTERVLGYRVPTTYDVALLGPVPVRSGGVLSSNEA